jgi:hypothetical protein
VTENINVVSITKFKISKPMISAGFQKYQWAESGSGDAEEGGTSRRFSSTVMLALLHRLSQFFLVIGKQSINLEVRFVADHVNLRTKFLPGKLSDSCRAAPESYRGTRQARADLTAAVS